MPTREIIDCDLRQTPHHHASHFGHGPLGTEAELLGCFPSNRKSLRFICEKERSRNELSELRWNDPSSLPTRALTCRRGEGASTTATRHLLPQTPRRFSDRFFSGRAMHVPNGNRADLSWFYSRVKSSTGSGHVTEGIPYSQPPSLERSVVVRAEIRNCAFFPREGRRPVDPPFELVHLSLSTLSGFFLSFPRTVRF